MSSFGLPQLKARSSALGRVSISLYDADPCLLEHLRMGEAPLRRMPRAALCRQATRPIKRLGMGQHALRWAAVQPPSIVALPRSEQTWVEQTVSALSSAGRRSPRRPGGT